METTKPYPTFDHNWPAGKSVAVRDDGTSQPGDVILLAYVVDGSTGVSEFVQQSSPDHKTLRWQGLIHDPSKQGRVRSRYSEYVVWVEHMPEETDNA